MKNVSESHKTLIRIVAAGLMAALVYAGNYLQIQIPNGILLTRIHLGNSMCLLAGLLFGPVIGGLSSGIGAALFDLFTPAYVLSAPYTFISKFAMGYAAGALMKALTRKNSEKAVSNAMIAGISGQLTYIVLYLLKSFFTVLIINGANDASYAAAWTAVGNNSITSTINAVAAVVISVPLAIALKKALRSTEIGELINAPAPEKKGWLNPLTGTLTVLVCILTTAYCMNIAAQSKIEKAQNEEKQQLEDRMTELENKIDMLAENQGFVFPAETEITEDN